MKDLAKYDGVYNMSPDVFCAKVLSYLRQLQNSRKFFSIPHRQALEMAIDQFSHLVDSIPRITLERALDRYKF